MINNNSVLIIDCDSAGLGGTDVTSYLTKYNVQYPKLWAEGTGRNLAGEMKATLIGIYTKLQVSVRPNIGTDAVASLITSLDKAEVYCKYFDVKTKTYRVEKFYFGDIESELVSGQLGKYALNDFSIIAYNKREEVSNA